MAALPLITAFSITDFAIHLIFIAHCIKKNCFYHFQGLFVIIQETVSKFKDNTRTNCTFFRIPGVCQDQGHFQGLFVIIQETVSKFKDNTRTNCTFFRIPRVCKDQDHFQGLFKVCVNPVDDWR